MSSWTSSRLRQLAYQFINISRREIENNNSKQVAHSIVSLWFHLAGVRAKSWPTVYGGESVGAICRSGRKWRARMRSRPVAVLPVRLECPLESRTGGGCWRFVVDASGRLRAALFVIDRHLMYSATSLSADLQMISSRRRAGVVSGGGGDGHTEQSVSDTYQASKVCAPLDGLCARFSLLDRRCRSR